MQTRVNTSILRVFSVTKRRSASSSNGPRILKVFHCYCTDISVNHDTWIALSDFIFNPNKMKSRREPRSYVNVFCTCAVLIGGFAIKNPTNGIFANKSSAVLRNVADMRSQVMWRWPVAIGFFSWDSDTVWLLTCARTKRVVCFDGFPKKATSGFFKRRYWKLNDESVGNPKCETVFSQNC